MNQEKQPEAIQQSAKLPDCRGRVIVDEYGECEISWRGGMPPENGTNIYTEQQVRALQAVPPAQAVAVPLQQFESPRAQILLRAFQEGWGACRDAEYAGEEAENDAFNRSATLGHCISEDQLHRPVAQAQEDARDTERLDWLTFNLSGSALRAIGVVWSEHADARRAIDAARAAQGGAA